MSGGNGPGVLPRGFFEGALGQVIEQPGQAVAGANEQLEGRCVKGVGVDADLLQVGLDVAGQFVWPSRASGAGKSSGGPRAAR